ncbi:MAG: hypothetical protein JXJ04_12980 [Spirochaetales bacterium]|nr:hypothetical protein [Spirochaetales bacterium]
MLKIKLLLIALLIAIVGMAGCQLDSANNDETELYTINFDADAKFDLPGYINIPKHSADNPSWSLKVEVTGSDISSYNFRFNEPYFLQAVYGGTYFEAYKVKSNYLPRANRTSLDGMLYVYATHKTYGFTLRRDVMIHLC